MDNKNENEMRQATQKQQQFFRNRCQNILRNDIKTEREHSCSLPGTSLKRLRYLISK